MSNGSSQPQSGHARVAQRAGSGPSLRSRNLVFAYEEADVRQHAMFPIAANGSKEPNLRFTALPRMSVSYNPCLKSGSITKCEHRGAGHMLTN